jgi:hypothetical protein
MLEVMDPVNITLTSRGVLAVFHRSLSHHWAVSVHPADGNGPTYKVSNTCQHEGGAPLVQVLR